MLRWLTSLRLALAAISLVALQTPGPFNAFGGEAPQLRGVYNALGGTMTPAWVAQDLGLFTKHGLQHSLNYLAATTAIQAIVGGTEEITASAVKTLSTRMVALKELIKMLGEARHPCADSIWPLPTPAAARK